MRHLNEEELIDLAEGTRADASAPHLASCEACRRQLNDLRATISEASGVEVPEPSPLFWDHLSARVHDSIATETPPRERAWVWWLIPASAFAALAVAASMTVGRNARPTAAHNDPAAAVADAGSETEQRSLANDPSLSLIADMASDLDWDAVAEAGLTGGDGTVDRALLELTAEERVELQRILKEEMSKS